MNPYLVSKELLHTSIRASSLENLSLQNRVSDGYSDSHLIWEIVFCSKF